MHSTCARQPSRLSSALLALHALHALPAWFNVQVSAQLPSRSIDQGLPPPAVIRSPSQLRVSRAILTLAPRLQAALGDSFQVYPNLLETTTPGLHIVLPLDWQSPAVTLPDVEGLLRLKRKGASMKDLGKLLKECQCGGFLPAALKTLAAALCGEQPLPHAWAEVRCMARPAVQCLLEQHLQFARDAAGGDAGSADEAGGSAAAPRRFTRSGGKGGHSGEEPRLKKQRLPWSEQVIMRCQLWLDCHRGSCQCMRCGGGAGGCVPAGPGGQECAACSTRHG